MPEEGVPLTKNQHLLSTEEIIKLAQIFVQEGVRKIRLTGGEPLVNKDIIHIIHSLKNIPGKLAIYKMMSYVSLSTCLEPL